MGNDTVLTRKWFRCPSCQHDFPLRVKHKRDIKCPKCRSAFQQGLALLSGDDAINARREHLARRQSRLIERRVRIAKSERRSIANHVPQSPLSVIRGDQVPVSLSELEFKLRATEKGWRVHRPSWPDFLVETPDGECFAVEVKSRTDSVRGTQSATFSLLEKMGVRCFIWKNVKGMKASLVRWGSAQGKGRDL